MQNQRCNTEPAYSANRLRVVNSFAGQDISKNDRVVVLLVASSRYKRDGLSARQAADTLELPSLSLKLCLVPSAELFPPRGIVGKPFTQFRAGRDLLGPVIAAGGFFAQSTRPQSVHQDADAIVQRGLLISSLDLDVECQILPHFTIADATPSPSP